MRTYLSSIPLLIYRLARRDSDKVAVIDTDLKAYTYRQLNSMADTIAGRFPAEKPRLVAILASAGVGQIAAILAVLKQRAAYLPLDPALNSAAIRRIAAEARVDFIIADSENSHRLAGLDVLELPARIESDDTLDYAPLIFGRKDSACVMPALDGGFDHLSCMAVRKHAGYLCERFGITSSDVVLQSNVATSQMFLAEVFATFMKGATLAILPEKKRGYAEAVADFADRAGVTVICGSKPMADDLGLLGRMPSRLRLFLGMATNRLQATFKGFNKANAWLDWFAVSF